MKSECLRIAKILEDLVSPYGFERKEETFWRITNNVCQKVSIETFSVFAKHWKCRVNFGIFPLCRGLKERDILFQNEPYSLDRFDRKDISELNRWIYTAVKEDRLVCEQKVRSMVTKYMIPFFLQAISCETALAEIQSMESVIFSEPFLLDLNKCYMAIRTEQWELALRIMECFVLNNLAGYERRLTEYTKNHATLPSEKGIEHLVQYLQNSEYEKIEQLFFENDPLQVRVQEAYVIRDRKRLDKFTELCERIKQRDYAYFDALFAANEEISRATFSNLPNSTFSWRKFMRR